MSNREAIKRASEAGQAVLKALSREFQAEWENRKMFPSTTFGDRGATSPLGGLAQPSAEQATTKSTKRP
jgi:hypothetical protein